VFVFFSIGFGWIRFLITADETPPLLNRYPALLFALLVLCIGATARWFVLDARIEDSVQVGDALRRAGKTLEERRD